MKKRSREFDIFNLSFLDIISCGFGAVVILILISKTNDGLSISATDQIQGLLNEVLTLENIISDISHAINIQDSEIEKILKKNVDTRGLINKTKKEMLKQDSKQAELVENLQGLSLVESSLKQAAISTSRKKIKKRDEEVGGIPVDSDYVIFVIDTSGSMKQIWPRVSSKIINVLNIHPQVKGFQILDDMGKSLISGYEGKWMPDTPARRKGAISVLKKWANYSNSSPAEGIKIALSRYAKPNLSTSIYVFGDDYTGPSYDSVINEITMNNSSKTGDGKLAKIHGIGFISAGTTDRFGIFMRELAKRNNGTYLALP